MSSHRETLLAALRGGHDEVIVTVTKDGQQCATRGRVTSVTATHTVISWGSGESCIALANVKNIEIAAPQFPTVRR